MDFWARGLLVIGRLNGRVPIRMHWTAPLGILALGPFRWAPGFWVGAALLIVLHECGHAVLAWMSGASVLSIDVYPFGGACRWTGRVSPARRAAIAWGGVLAQGMLVGTAVVATRFGLWPPTPFFEDLAQSWAFWNIVLIVANLVPVEPFDGAAAWSILSAVAAAARGR